MCTVCMQVGTCSAACALAAALAYLSILNVDMLRCGVCGIAVLLRSALGWLPRPGLPAGSARGTQVV
jgi:hypothetical protein